jgi:hypothetical protein
MISPLEIRIDLEKGTPMSEPKFVEVSIDGQPWRVAQLEQQPTRQIGLVYDFRKTPAARFIDAETGHLIEGVKTFSLKRDDQKGLDELTITLVCKPTRNAQPHIVK